jgi:hypothetical protein
VTTFSASRQTRRLLNFRNPFGSWCVIYTLFRITSRSIAPAFLLQTYFTATIFTDAGIDLYARGKLTDEEYDKIVEALRAHQGETEADKELQKLAVAMFKIPVGNV